MQVLSETNRSQVKSRAMAIAATYDHDIKTRMSRVSYAALRWLGATSSLTIICMENRYSLFDGRHRIYKLYVCSQTEKAIYLGQRPIKIKEMFNCA